MKNEVPDNVSHSFQLHLDIIDADTGEVLTRNQSKEVTTEFSDLPDVLTSWINCYYRGLRAGRCLAIQISAKRFAFPVQLNLF